MLRYRSPFALASLACASMACNAIFGLGELSYEDVVDDATTPGAPGTPR